MTKIILLQDVLKDSDYQQSLFNLVQITEFEKRLIIKTDKNGKNIPYIQCLVRKKEIRLTPEEAVRQLYLDVLLNHYGYPASRMELEYVVSFGREKKRADIVIFDKDQTTTPYIIVEIKKPKLKDGKEQLKSYCNATGAPIGVWTNGEQISCYNRKDPNFFEAITEIPNVNQKLSDIINERFTYDDLQKRDKIQNEKRSLRSLIEEMEDEVLASAGVDSFEEIFKLIFTKLYDELVCARDKNSYLQFRNSGDSNVELKSKIQKLFDDAKIKWEGVFADDSKILRVFTERYMRYYLICTCCIANFMHNWYLVPRISLSPWEAYCANM